MSLISDSLFMILFLLCPLLSLLFLILTGEAELGRKMELYWLGSWPGGVLGGAASSSSSLQFKYRLDSSPSVISPSLDLFAALLMSGVDPEYFDSTPDFFFRFAIQLSIPDESVACLLDQNVSVSSMTALEFADDDAVGTLPFGDSEAGLVRALAKSFLREAVKHS